MNILFINNFFNPGGSTLTSLELAKSLKEDGHTLTFVGCYGTELISEFEQLGTVWHTFGYVPPQFDLYGICFLRNDSDKEITIIELVEEFKPDIIHIFIPGQENPRYFKTLPQDCIKICTVLCGQKIGFDPSLFDCVTFLSEYSKGLSNPSNGKVIRPGLGEQEKSVNRRFFGDIVFGRISAFCPSKKIIDTVECAKACPEFKFIIAGEIQDHTYALQIENECKNLKNVILDFNISEEKKKEYLKEIDVLHYPTSNESFCYSILEAMASQKIILSYKNSAIPEFIKNNEVKKGLYVCDNGIFLVNNIEELKESTIRLSNFIYTSRLILGNGNLKVYNKHYTREKYKERMLKVYDECRTQRKYIENS